MAEMWLVCEGEDTSVDVEILRAVFATVLPVAIVVEPAGSKTGAKVVMQFLQRRRGGTAAYVVDRDYSPRSESEIAFASGGPGFLWRRHSIENYLLSPQIILRGFRQVHERFELQRPRGVPSWVTALPTDLAQVGDALRECARRRAAEEASRLANHRLWASLPAHVGQVQKRNPSIAAGDDTTDPSYWRDALRKEIERVRNAAEQTAAARPFQSENTNSLFDAAYAEITAAPYVASMEFLVDFHGRDLLWELQKWLTSQRAQLSFKVLRRELGPAAVREYDGNRMVYGQDDFRDLANGVLSLAGMPTLP